jgi:hypothetical protein
MSGSTANVMALDVLLATGVALESSARRGDGWATAAQALGASMRITRGEP